MDNKQKALIIAARKFLYEVQKVYGADETNKIWEQFIEIIPNGKELAQEILLDVLKCGELLSDEEKNTSAYQQATYERISRIMAEAEYEIRCQEQIKYLKSQITND